MIMTVAVFRTTFPAFESQSLYPDPAVIFWLRVAEKLHNADRWGNLLDLGISMFTAHHLTLEAMAMKDARMGKPSMPKGPLVSGSIDKVSATYDQAGTIQQNAGHWNMTVWGRRWHQLARTMGAGPVQVGTPSGAGGTWASQAWPGVF